MSRRGGATGPVGPHQSEPDRSGRNFVRRDGFGYLMSFEQPDLRKPHALGRFRRLWREFAAAAVGAAMLVAIVPAGGSAAGLEEGVRNPVVVVSVDGPRDFTVERARHRYRVRIDNIDAPRAAAGGRRAECGANLATRELRRLATVGRRIFVFAYGLRQSGRFLVDAELEVGYDNSDEWFSDTLIERGVARPGIGQSVWAHVIPNTDLVDMNYYPYLGKGGFFAADPVNLARRRVGVWGACHGRFHLPGGERPPRVRPAAWQITPEGRTTAIGPLQILPTDEQPTAVTTFGDAARAFPDLEVVRSYTGLCVGTSGAGALRFQGVDAVQHVGSKHRHPCAVAPIRSITSLGRSATGGGVAVGGPTATLAAAFPSLLADPRYAEFDGVPPSEDPNIDLSSPTLWRTAAILARGQITGFYTRLPDHW